MKVEWREITNIYTELNSFSIWISISGSLRAREYHCSFLLASSVIWAISYSLKTLYLPAYITGTQHATDRVINYWQDPKDPAGSGRATYLPLTRLYSCLISHFVYSTSWKIRKCPEWRPYPFWGFFLKLHIVSETLNSILIFQSLFTHPVFPLPCTQFPRSLIHVLLFQQTQANNLAEFKFIVGSYI